MRSIHGQRARRARPRPLALLALCAALIPAAAGAQAPIDSTRLADLYVRVQRDNPRVTAAQALVRAAEARVPGARRPPDPELQLGFMNRELPSFAPMDPLGMTQLQLMQMLPLGGKLALAGRVAEAKASAVAFQVDEVLSELRSATAMAFYDFYAADRQLSVARETLRLLQDIRRTAESMYRVGEGRQADVLRAQVELARMAEDTLRMTAMRDVMVAKLNALLNAPGGAALPSPSLPAVPAAVPARASLDSLAVANRPMIRAGLEELRAADAAAALARREIFPDLQVGVQYGQRAGEMGTERMGSLMIGASVPIFARDRQLRMRAETDAMRVMAQADVAAMRAASAGRVGEVYAALQRARNLAQLYRTTVLPQAQAAVASALAAYRVGQVDFMTLLDNQMAVNRYRQEAVALDAEEGKAWAELEMLTARTLIDTAGAPAGGVR